MKDKEEAFIWTREDSLKKTGFQETDKNQGTAWHLEELQFVGHAQRPNHKSESYETHSEKGQQGYTVKGLFGH